VPNPVDLPSSYCVKNVSFLLLPPCGSTAQFWALTASIKLFVSFRLLHLGQSAGLLGRVISSSQGLCVSAPGDCDDEVGGIKRFWQGKLKYSEITFPHATLSTTNPTCQTRTRTRAAAVGSQRLAASAMARPPFLLYSVQYCFIIIIIEVHQNKWLKKFWRGRERVKWGRHRCEEPLILLPLFCIYCYIYLNKLIFYSFNDAFYIVTCRGYYRRGFGMDA
jgi:hypothetical protein